MKLTLRVWRQKDGRAPGRFETHPVDGVSPDMSFLEVLDLVNEGLIARGAEPFAFDSDCREGICGTCSLMVNGRAHGREHGSTVCELRLRAFRDGETVTVEPFRARAFPLLRDLSVDRSALDAIIAAGGYVSVNTGAASDASAVPIPKDAAEQAMDAAQCIGCGACVAACPNAAAMLFTGGKITHLALLPQGRLERARRALAMVAAMDRAGFGNCSNHGECEAACPKELKLAYLARLNRHFTWSALFAAAGPGEAS